MKYLRATIRLFALGGVMAGYYLLWLAGLAVVFAFPAASRKWRNWIFGGWARASAHILGMKIDVRNQPPAAPFLLVANHLSYVDIVLLRSQMDCAFVAKSEVAAWPILGLVCRSMNTIFVDRKRKRDTLKAIPRIEQAMTQESGVVLFAEGTSTDGRTVTPFRSSLLEGAAKNHLPVHYACISYAAPATERPAHESICWWGEMTFPGHIFSLLQLREFEARLVFGSTPIVAGDRRVLAAQLWSAVSAQFTPVVAQRYGENEASSSKPRISNLLGGHTK